MPGQPCTPHVPTSVMTSLDTSPSSVTQHLEACLQKVGATALAEKVGRCCTTFRVLACDQGHAYHPIPAERCRLRPCIHCARWRQQRAVTRLGPAIRELSRRHPEDRWIFIILTAHASDEPLHTRLSRVKRWFARLRRTAAWKTAIRGAEGSKRLRTCIGDLARIQPVPRLGSGGRRRA